MACQVKRDHEVEKAFWNEAKKLLKGKKVTDPSNVKGESYQGGLEPEAVINAIAKKHGIGTDAVGAILAQPKGLFQLTNEAWAKQAKVHELSGMARRAIGDADRGRVGKALQMGYESTRRVLTFGHGGVIPFTHARNSLFIPGEARIFAQTAREAYSYLTPNSGSARWRANMALLRTDPKFNFWSRNGLDIKLQSKPVGMGMTRWTRQSFDALKTMRLKLAKKYWDQLDPADRTMERAQDISKRINHATGVTNTPPIVNKIASAAMFAPKLRFAKYATVVDAVTSGLGAKRFAKLAAVNLGILAANDLFNRHVAKNNDRVNWTDPEKADWLRGKVFGMTLPLAPMFETARLPVAAAAVMMNPNEDNKAKVLTKEIASALHPTLNAGYGIATGKDLATGATLPFKGLSQYIYGEHRSERKFAGRLVKDKFERKEGKGEYASGFAPIPLQPILKEMAKEGIPPDLSRKFLEVYAEALLSGVAGTHAYPNSNYGKKK